MFTWSFYFKPLYLHVTLKAPFQTAADDALFYSIDFYLSEKIKIDISCESSVLADNSHEILSHIFSEKLKRYAKEYYLQQF